jgi:hypothetical protein
VGPLSGIFFIHQRLKQCADALARLALRGAPQRRFPAGMPARRCRRRPQPLPSRCARAAILSSVPIGSTKRGQARSPMAKQPAAPHPRDRDARRPAPPAPADRASPGKVIIFGRSGRGRKKRVEKRSRSAPLDKVYVAESKGNWIFVYMILESGGAHKIATQNSFTRSFAFSSTNHTIPEWRYNSRADPAASTR